MYNFKDKLVVITGAARGIGYATAEKFAENGAIPIILGRNLEGAQKAADNLKDKGYQAYAARCDVADRSSAKEAADEIYSRFNHVDYLINNAGIMKDAIFHKMSGEAWDSVINTNLTGVFNVCSAFVPRMRARKEGGIVIVSSVNARGNVGQANYSASKAGLIGFTRTLARELASSNIRVNAVLPGMVNTQILGAMPEDIRARMAESVPMRRLSEPAEQANVIAFLCSDEASYITGQCVVVDGGFSLR